MAKTGIEKPSFTDTLRDAFVKYPGPLPAHVAQRPDYLSSPLAGGVTNALFPGNHAVMNQDYPKTDPKARFVVEIVENGYVLETGGKTYICADINKVGERVVALLAAKQMDAK